jgi:hypothetical protein
MSEFGSAVDKYDDAEASGDRCSRAHCYANKLRMRPPQRSGSCLLACLLALLQLACGDDSDDAPAGTDAGGDDGGRGGAGGAAGGDAGRRVSYARDVKPILQQRCVICHHPGGVVGYDLVDPFDPEHGIVGRANSWQEAHDSPYALLVKPGAPDESFLIYKVAHDPQDFDPENNGGPMPAVIPRATDEELANIKRWITDGAQNDMFFTEKVAPIFGTAITLGSRIGKCTLCHYPNSPTGLNILAPFDSAVGLVGADSVLSTKPRVMPGSPADSFLIEKLEAKAFGAGAPMPLNYERLSDEDVDILRKWIAQGALDD